MSLAESSFSLCIFRSVFFFTILNLFGLVASLLSALGVLLMSGDEVLLVKAETFEMAELH